VAGFVLSALLVVSVRLPQRTAAPVQEGAWIATTKGIRIMLRTPRLRGSLALEMAVAAAGAMVLVNTVVIVRADLGLGDGAVALALGAFGGGSMTGALLTPLLLDRARERAVMLGGGALMVVGVALGTLAGSVWTLMALWALIGLGFALTQTPIGRLLVRSANPEDRPAVYAAQFALSHACWLLAYPLAGQFGAWLGLRETFVLMTALGAAGLATAWVLWPVEDPEAVPHGHPDLPPDHPHLAEHQRAEGHPFRIDRLHRHWPGSGRAGAA
jgi:predicted MFS family arabinose efflux permease